MLTATKKGKYSKFGHGRHQHPESEKDFFSALQLLFHWTVAWVPGDPKSTSVSTFFPLERSRIKISFHGLFHSPFNKPIYIHCFTYLFPFISSLNSLYPFLDFKLYTCLKSIHSVPFNFSYKEFNYNPLHLIYWSLYYCSIEWFSHHSFKPIPFTSFFLTKQSNHVPC